MPRNFLTRPAVYQRNGPGSGVIEETKHAQNAAPGTVAWPSCTRGSFRIIGLLTKIDDEVVELCWVGLNSDGYRVIDRDSKLAWLLQWAQERELIVEDRSDANPGWNLPIPGRVWEKMDDYRN